MPYRETPSLCAHCGELLDEQRAEITEVGWLCYRCGRQAEIDRHLAAPRPSGLSVIVDALVGVFRRDRAIPRTRISEISDAGEQRAVGTLRQRGELLESPLRRHACLGYCVTLREERSFSRRLARIAEDVWLQDGTGAIAIDPRSTVIAPSEHEAEAYPGSPLWLRISELLACEADFAPREHHGSYFFREVCVLPNEPASIKGVVTVDMLGARQLYGDVERMVHLA